MIIIIITIIIIILIIILILIIINFGATLESFFTYDDDFVATFVALRCHFGRLRTALGALWADFGVTWGALAAYGVTLGPLWGHFEVTLGSFWGHFGVSFDICR